MIVHSNFLSGILINSLSDIRSLWPRVYEKLLFDSKRLGMHILKYKQKLYELSLEKQFIMDLSSRNY